MYGLGLGSGSNKELIALGPDSGPGSGPGNVVGPHLSSATRKEDLPLLAVSRSFC